jgi:hypothetical protein
LNLEEKMETSASTLADRLRWWIVAIGYALAGWAIFQTLFMFAAWGNLFNRFFPSPALTALHGIATLCYLAAPLLLLAGCWGFQHHRRWARPFLLSYAGAWVGGVFLMQVIQFMDIMSQSVGGFNPRQLFASALGTFDLLIYSSVYPIALVVCLTRTEIRDNFSELGRGFSPIVADRPDDVG